MVWLVGCPAEPQRVERHRGPLLRADERSDEGAQAGAADDDPCPIQPTILGVVTGPGAGVAVRAEEDRPDHKGDGAADGEAEEGVPMLTAGRVDLSHQVPRYHPSLARPREDE